MSLAGCRRLAEILANTCSNCSASLWNHCAFLRNDSRRFHDAPEGIASGYTMHAIFTRRHSDVPAEASVELGKWFESHVVGVLRDLTILVKQKVLRLFDANRVT